MEKIKNNGSTIAVIILCSLLSSCLMIKQSSDKNGIRTAGLIAYYPFNQNAIDMSGNNNNGKVNGAILTSDRNGNEKSAYTFDGVNDFIYVPDSEILRITGQITISAWFKTDYALAFAGIVCKAEPREPRHGYLIDINDNNKVRIDVINDHSKGIGGTLVSDNDLTDNKWHHVLFCYDGKLLKLYIDGTLEKELFYDKGLQANGEPLLIGWDESTWLSHRHFKGSLDDIRIYNRALNKKEIVRLFKEN